MKKNVLIALLTFVILGCGSGDDPITPTPVVNKPTRANLVFPSNNTECLEGTNITATESSVTFEWENAQHTHSYELVLKNLDSKSINKFSSTNSFNTVAILKGTPYSWYIISKSNETSDTASSEIWKFYNAGDAIVSHAPFPAEVISPENSSNINVSANTVSLEWTASDIDGDISSYSLYFGTTEDPPLLQDTITSTKKENITVNSGTKYYWYIITRDSSVNKSTSELFNFTVN